MTHRTKKKLIIIVCGLIMLTVRSSVIFAQTPTGGVGVFYIGPEDVVAEAINLAHPYIVRVDQPELAQVIVLNNSRIPEESLAFYGEQVRNNRLGLVIFCGNIFPETLADLGAILGISAFGMTQLYTPSAVVVEDKVDEIQKSVTWSSAPEIYARTVISNPNILLPLIFTENRQPIIQRIRGREPSQTLLMGVWLDDTSNTEWVDWPYYNYLIYQLIVDAAGRSRTLNYADYPFSPVPQRNARWLIAGTGIGVILGTAAVFYLARRFRFMHSGDRQYQTPPKDAVRRGPGVWNNAGFHKPLAGMFVLLPLNILMFFLLVRYRLHTLPEVLAPNSRIYYSWQIVAHWAEVIWLVFDAGMGIAVVHYFASVQVRRPQRAFSYFQFYGWWHLIIGAIQLGIVCILSATLTPWTDYAHLTYIILVQAIMRFPGLLTIFVLFFRAIQRFDYEQYLGFFLTFGSVAMQGVAYVALRTWGTSLPAFGMGQMEVLSLGFGLYAAEWLVFILGLFLYRTQGYQLEALFTPTSDPLVRRQLLSFGFRTVLGSLTIPLGALVELYVFKNILPELNLVWRNWLIAVQIAYIFDLLLQQFYRNMLPTLSEAIALNYQTLLRYYMTQGVRYGVWLSVFLFAVFATLGEPLVDILFTGAYREIADVLLPLLAIATFRWATWLVDALLLAAERPLLSSALILIEQTLCIVGGFFLAIRWGTPGFLSAYAIAFSLRTILTWFFMQRFIIRVHIYIWQTLVSPLISGVLLYFLLHAILENISPIWYNGLAISALVIGLWIYAFLTAVFGGWDNANIKELGRAMQLSGIGKPYAWGLWQCIQLGARISPLHGRFPIVIASIAEEQSSAITFTRSAGE